MATRMINSSELVRELLEKYTRERDMRGYIDHLWEKTGQNLTLNNISDADIKEAIKAVRSKSA